MKCQLSLKSVWDCIVGAYFDFTATETGPYFSSVQRLLVLPGRHYISIVQDKMFSAALECL